MRNLIPLAAIEVFVWLILLLSTFLISKVAFAISFGDATLIQRVATETARVAASGVIILIWLLVWKRVTDSYFWRTVSRRKATA
jgi:type VI protein secretion system component VasK